MPLWRYAVDSFMHAQRPASNPQACSGPESFFMHGLPSCLLVQHPGHVEQHFSGRYISCVLPAQAIQQQGHPPLFQQNIGGIPIAVGEHPLCHLHLSVMPLAACLLSACVVS